jgi:hypothetical protein
MYILILTQNIFIYHQKYYKITSSRKKQSLTFVSYMDRIENEAFNNSSVTAYVFVAVVMFYPAIA